jgi:hypothetical protein
MIRKMPTQVVWTKVPVDPIVQNAEIVRRCGMRVCEMMDRETKVTALTYLKPTKSSRRQLFDWTLILTHLIDCRMLYGVTRVLIGILPSAAGLSRPVRSLIHLLQTNHASPSSPFTLSQKTDLQRLCHRPSCRYHPGQNMPKSTAMGSDGCLLGYPPHYLIRRWGTFGTA